jgi:hypothetical protein
MKVLGGSIPQQVMNPDGRGIKPLFHSLREVALILDKTFAPGYGVLKAGTVCCENSSTLGNKGKVYPFVPAYGSQVAALNTDAAIGVAPMVANSSTGHVYVSIADSYKFIVGDELYFENTSGSGLVSCGAITAIDRTTNPIYADIATGAFTATYGTVALHAYVYVVSGATPFSVAKYILDKDIDTGTGEDAVGAIGTVVISNAILYNGSLININAVARTSLSATLDGRFTILK